MGSPVPREEMDMSAILGAASDLAQLAAPAPAPEETSFEPGPQMPTQPAPETFGGMAQAQAMPAMVQRSDEYFSHDYVKNEPGQLPPGQMLDLEKFETQRQRAIEGSSNRYVMNLSDIERKHAEEQNQDLDQHKDFDALFNEFETAMGGPEVLPTDVRAATGEEFAANPAQAAKDYLTASFARFRAGLGRSDQEYVNAIQNVYGAENVMKKEGRLFIRRRKGEAFRALDPDQFEIFNDILADFSGPIIEGAVAVGTEAALLAAAGGEAATGIGIPAGIATVLGSVAVSGATGAAARSGTIEALDALTQQKQKDDNVSVLSEMLWGAGFNLAAFGAGSLLKAGLSKVLKTSADATEAVVRNQPVEITASGKSMKVSQRAMKLAEASNKLDDFASTLGLGKPPVGQPRVELDEAARSAFGAVDRLGEFHESSVGLVKDEVISMAGKNTFQVQNGMAKIKEVLDNQGVLFDDNGKAFLPSKAPSSLGDLIDEFGEEYAEEQLEVGAKKALRQEGVDAVKAVKTKSIEERFAFGSRTGGNQLNELISDFNSLLDNTATEGGVNAKNLLNIVKRYQQQSNFGFDQFKNPLSGEQIAAYKQLQHAFGMDRDAMIGGVLKGTPMEATWKSSFDDFAANIDAVNHFRLNFKNADSARPWAESFLQPKKLDEIKQLKGLIGSQSQEWLTLRNSWLGEMIKKATPTTDGILRTDKLLGQLAKFDKATLSELMTVKEQAAFIRLAENVKDIPFDDLVKKPKIRSIVKDAVVLFGNALSTTKGDVMANWFMKNARITNEIFEALKQEAIKAPTKTQKHSIVNVINKLKGIVDNSGRISVPRKHPKTGKTVMTKMWVPIGRQARVQGINTLRQGAGSLEGIQSEESSAQMENIMRQSEEQALEFGDVQ